MYIMCSKCNKTQHISLYRRKGANTLICPVCGNEFEIQLD